MGRPLAVVDPIRLRSLACQLSDEEIAKELGLARVTVTGARKRLGIPSFTQATGLKRRDGAATHGGRLRRIRFNESFFSSLDSQASAYFLGLLFADGCVAKRANTVEITLAEPDDHVLRDFVHSIEGHGCQIRPRRRDDRVKTFHRLTLCSKTMADSLIAWGMGPGSKSAMQLNRPIPVELVGHFVRGFWDGDGHIGRKSFEAGIQSEKFAAQFATMISQLGGERPKIRKTSTSAGKPFHVVDVKAERFECFRHELYRDAEYFMKRKRDSFLENWC